MWSRVVLTNLISANLPQHTKSVILEAIMIGNLVYNRLKSWTSDKEVLALRACCGRLALIRLTNEKWFLLSASSDHGRLCTERL